MTPRYIVIMLGCRRRRREIAARITVGSDLAIVADGVEVTVLANAKTSRLGPNGPLLIGDIFFDSGADRKLAASPVCAAITPQALIGRAWGRYIALWDDNDRGVRILRDPSGATPCYHRSSAGLVLVASDLDLLERALPTASALDWAEIGRSLIEVDLRTPATAIAGTLELLAGNVLTITPGATLVTQAWSPWDFVGVANADTPQDHAARLRDRVDMVMAGLAKAHPHAIATVSGGLDSSIVALSLGKLTDALTCVTLATVDPSGDERRYARLVAEAARSGYDEHMLEDSSVDLQRSQAAHLPRPIGRPFLGCMTNAFVALAQARGATAIFNGTGGDNVFCYLQSATPVADRLASGEFVGALASVADVARLTGASYLEVAAAALRQLRGRSRRRGWRRDRRFLSTQCEEETLSSFEHPWLKAPASAGPGSIAHIVMLLRIQNYLDPWTLGMEFDVINPLLAQPIVECCLGIPSWEWCRGGVDRAVARRAFVDLLPPAIRRRTWKAGPDGFVTRLLDRHRATMRSMLLDGELMGHGLLDRTAIVAVLDDPRPPGASDALRLLMLTDAEAWVRGRA